MDARAAVDTILVADVMPTVATIESIALIRVCLLLCIIFEHRALRTCLYCGQLLTF